VDYATSSAPAPKNDRNAWAEPGVEDLGGGVHRIPLPLPGDALTAVNVYAITSDTGVDLIDSGMALPQARAGLTAALGQLGYGLPDVRNFFITHIHRDHYTLAVELRTTLRGQITLGEGERVNMDAIRDVSAGRAGIGFIAMLPAMGAADLAERARALLSPRLADPQPRLEWDDPDQWLPDGALIELPGRTLRAIHTPGHTSGHVVFRDPAAGILFAGDHVLPHITPSIGFQPVITRLALSQYLGSLRLMLTLPDMRLLPAHGPVQDSTHARVHQLLEHHEVRLAQTLEAASQGPVCAFAVAGALPWTRRKRKLTELDTMNQLLATGETSAHLEVLVIRGQLVRERTPEGIDVYHVPPAAAPGPQP
jgi:glyoxylase-like metal-dependent hydrolase (beta-lactamase superfamily II)